MTRGHKSQYGIGCVIEVMTGLVIDLQVMSLYCQRCAYASTRHGGAHTRGFIEWFKTHEPECNKNYEGPLGGMEMKAAELQWDQSTNRGFRYTTVLSDGDARTFNHLSSLQVYGEVELQKEECINHVAKRLGTVQVGRVREEGWRHPRRSGQGQVETDHLRTMARQCVTTRTTSAGCRVPSWRHSNTPSRQATSRSTTAARWELTACASTRRHSSPDRSWDRIG